MNRIAFWNVFNKADVNLISALCREHQLDVLVLAEVGLMPALEISSEISRQIGRVFHYVNDQSFRIKIFTSLGRQAVVPLIDHQYFSVVRIMPPLGPDYLLVGVHLPSKMNQESSDQAIISQRISNRVREIERECGIDKTVVIGDFNMNPFEHGLVNSDGFHAVMDRGIAARGARTVLYEQHPFFYNPMWSLHGDGGEGPSGSYYNQTSSPLCYFWNLFDQAIFRPSLLRYLPSTPVKIVENIEGRPLLLRGVPDHEISDHLPIRISFKSNNEVNHVDQLMG